jgi:hypothetical protein
MFIFNLCVCFCVNSNGVANLLPFFWSGKFSKRTTLVKGMDKQQSLGLGGRCDLKNVAALSLYVRVHA